ncbi:MAG: cyclic nucleotide-binding domain-containing protein [Acidimicrobiales bacterium]
MSKSPQQQPSTTHSITDATIFVHCNRHQRERLESLSSTAEVKAGYQLTKEGTTGLEFGVIVDGTAEVSVGGRKVADLGPGDHYGEVALLERIGHHGPPVRMATVTATTDMRVAVMSVQEFNTVLVEFPDVADAMRRAARDRAGTANAIKAD